MPGKRALDAVVEKRIGEVFTRILRGASKAEILRHLAKNAVGANRTADWYIGKASARFKAMAKVDAERELGLARAQLADLYSQNLRASDLQEARRVRKDLTELLGIAAPRTEKHEHTGRDGAPISLLVGRLDMDPTELRRRLREELARDEAEEGGRPPLPAPAETD